MKRRGFLAGLAGAVAASPVLVKAVAWAAETVPMPAPIKRRFVSISEIVQTTIRRRSKEIAANITANNKLLQYLKHKGPITPPTD